MAQQPMWRVGKLGAHDAGIVRFDAQAEYMPMQDSVVDWASKREDFESPTHLWFFHRVLAEAYAEDVLGIMSAEANAALDRFDRIVQHNQWTSEQTEEVIRREKERQE